MLQGIDQTKPKKEPNDEMKMQFDSYESSDFKG